MLPSCDHATWRTLDSILLCTLNLLVGGTIELLDGRFVDEEMVEVW